MSESILSIVVVSLSTVVNPMKKKRLARALLSPSTELDQEEFEAQLLEGEVDEEDIKEEEADVRVVVGGVVLSILSCICLVSIVFGEEGIKWWATAIALVLACMFSILG